jgi:hypothetical protein
VKYAEDLVLLVKEGAMLQDMIDTLVEIWRCYGMEMNQGKVNFTLEQAIKVQSGSRHIADLLC